VKLKPGDYRYAVAIHDGSALWLTLWVRRSPKGEFFVLYPRADRRWNPHTSYHLDGRLHQKSYNHKALPPSMHQPLTGTFHGTEHLGVFAGHGTGIPCDPAGFSGVVQVAPGVLGPHAGMVAVDLVEPGIDPILAIPGANAVQRQVFADFIPWVVITILSHSHPALVPVVPTT